jgi:predicted outer membrane protein
MIHHTHAGFYDRQYADEDHLDDLAKANGHSFPDAYTNRTTPTHWRIVNQHLPYVRHPRTPLAGQL